MDWCVREGDFLRAASISIGRAGNTSPKITACMCKQCSKNEQQPSSSRKNNGWKVKYFLLKIYLVVKPIRETV